MSKHGWFLLVLVGLAGCKHPIQLCTNNKVAIEPPPPVASTEPLYVMPLRSEPCAACRIAVVDVDGLLLNANMAGLYSHGENPVALFREKLDCIERDCRISAVVLRINSPGGGVTASDIMWHDLTAFKSRTHRPVVACLMDCGTGGSYYLATAADYIMAHPTAITGGMGVILNTYNLQDLMAQFNILGVPVKSGENTDLGTPVKRMSDQQRQILQQMADEYHARFQRIVQQARPQHPASATDDFDGRVFTAQQAQEKGLVDGIGYLDDAIESARQMSGGGPIEVVLLHRLLDKAHNPYAITPNVPIQNSIIPTSLPGLDRTRLPTFLYVWQPEPTVERASGR